MKLTSGLAALAVAASTLAVAAPTYAAQTAGDRSVAAGSTWLKAQLTDGILRNDEYGFDDLGLSADIAFGLDAVGGPATAVRQVADAVAPVVTDWYQPFAPTIYTGSAAKAIVLAQVAGKDLADFAGPDLQELVEDNVALLGPSAGRVQNVDETDFTTGEPTDSLNVISQSWAARALAGQESDLADEVMSFLLQQQCDDGSFRASLDPDKDAPDQGCADGATGEVDTTALAVINILETPDAPVAARGAAYLAASWLKAQQAADGSFSAGVLGVNSNTVGLAGWALGEAGHDAAATKAATWLRSIQVADLAPCASTLSADNGAVAYKPADLTAARTAGSISVPIRELARRATAQALPALAHLPAGGDVTISAPATAVEKSTVTVTVAGLGAGEAACVSLGTQSKQVTGTGSTVPVTFTLPAGAAAQTFKVTTLAGSATATTAATVAPAPAAPAVPAVGDLTVAKVVKVGKKGVFKVEVACEGAVACTGKVKVRTDGKVALGKGKKKKVLVVAKSAYSVAPGATAKVRLELTKPARAVLGTKRVRVVATQTAAGADPVTTKFWIRRK
ncbi:hypothetical protein F4692_000176 [Nocardioides cavernae]|uniref:Terpene cyclase/mutase family protein n=1 Tax=Nocardioides cavernae TaxID=1921566 RepID=A0A7Y9GZB3_9ACTN|nr:hypothetical protein [Nocardioides cavernae]NYE35072.1 hypothetical protein [Nocardioides cavernae]